VLATPTRRSRLLLTDVSEEHSTQSNKQQVRWHVLGHMVHLSYNQAVRDETHKYIRQITDSECRYVSGHKAGIELIWISKCPDVILRSLLCSLKWTTNSSTRRMDLKLTQKIVSYLQKKKTTTIYVTNILRC